MSYRQQQVSWVEEEQKKELEEFQREYYGASLVF